MKVYIKEGYSTTKKKVICDSNVWYRFQQGNFGAYEDGTIDLIPTYLSLAEIASSEVMVHDLKLFQNTIKAVYEKGGGIISIDPIDFVLRNHDPKFPIRACLNFEKSGSV